MKLQGTSFKFEENDPILLHSQETYSLYYYGRKSWRISLCIIDLLQKLDFTKENLLLFAVGL